MTINEKEANDRCIKTQRYFKNSGCFGSRGVQAYIGLGATYLREMGKKVALGAFKKLAGAF